MNFYPLNGAPSFEISGGSLLIRFTSYSRFIKNECHVLPLFIFYTAYISVHRRVYDCCCPSGGPYLFTPECVELKPPAGRRRIAVVKYSSSVPGGTLFLPADRPLLLRDPLEQQQRRKAV